MKEKKGIEYIGEGGYGSEANVKVYLCKRFPGIGGEIITYQAVTTAFRIENSGSLESGRRMFYRHAIIKKLEDYFFRKGIYGYAHITRPLGSIDKGYIYEWAFGGDGFPWEYTEIGGETAQIKLDEWNEFVGAFYAAGIDLSMDCADCDDGRISQNIIHQLAGSHVCESELNRIWKRIDFGQQSVRFDFDKLLKYLTDNEENLRKTLTIGRFEFLWLAAEYLDLRSKISERDLGRLEQLTLDYRMSTLSHLNMRGVEESPEIHLIPE